jgi:pyrimidine operon attenuation protein/uracil phosphoribosyltransferase
LSGAASPRICSYDHTPLIGEHLDLCRPPATLPHIASPAYDAPFMTPKPSPRLSNLREKGQLMSASEIERTLVRLVHEIVEKNNGATDLGLVGIRRRGVPLAQRLGQMIARIEKTDVPVGTLDITLYRDDLSTLGPKPVVQKTEIGFPISGKNIILVDDVLYTGRTIRAALDALFHEGRPKQVQLCVLIDRGHRELPIEAAFVGRKVQTSDREIIEVKLREVDDAEKVLLVERQD